MQVGLLSKDNEELIHFAYKLYRESGTQGPHKAAAFRSKVSRSVKVNFLGVWDTVASVGLAGTTLPSALSLGVIQHYRQALALDEHRAKFIQNSLYLTPDDISWNQAASVPKPYAWDTGRFRRIFRIFTLSTVSAKEQLGPSPNARDKSDCTYRDVWFVGNHNGKSLESSSHLHLLTLLRTRRGRQSEIRPRVPSFQHQFAVDDARAPQSGHTPSLQGERI